MATVRAKIRGKDPKDTEAQQDAAFEILDYYLKLRMIATASSGERVGPLVNTRMNEYARARSKPSNPGAAAYLNGGLAYHRTVLSRLLPPAAVRAYEATPGYQQLKLAEARQRNAASQAITETAPAMAPTSQVGQWVAEVRTAAAAAGVDLTVLGLKLAQPLSVPACAAVTPAKQKMADPSSVQQLLNSDYLVQRGTDPTPTQRCGLGQRDPSSGAMAEQMAALAGVQMKTTLPAGAVREYVYLPPGERPSWFSPGLMGLGSGSMAAVVAEGQVIAVEIFWLKSSDANFTVQAVQTKFPSVKAQRSNLECSNKYGARTPTYDVTWEMPTLRVIYSRGCGANEASLVFETPVVAKLQQRAQASRLAAEPKL